MVALISLSLSLSLSFQSFSSYNNGGGGWELANLFGYGHSGDRGGGWGSYNSFGSGELGGIKSSEGDWGIGDNESGPKFKTMTFIAKGMGSRGGFGCIMGGRRGGKRKICDLFTNCVNTSLYM